MSTWIDQGVLGICLCLLVLISKRLNFVFRSRPYVSLGFLGSFLCEKNSVYVERGVAERVSEIL
jgi:hypothetical protein